MPSQGYDDDPIGFSMNWTLSVGLVVIALVLVAAIAFALFRPTILRMESKANRNSPQFVDSKVTHLQSLHEDYLRLEREIVDFGNSSEFTNQVQTRRSQQTAVLSEMNREAALIDAQFVPQSIRTFLDQH